METLKGIGGTVLGIAVFAGIALALYFLFQGTVAVAEWAMPFLVYVNQICIAFCVLILLPLSLFRRTRSTAAVGFLIGSYVFGVGLWLYGFFVTYVFWGGLGIFIGLMLAVVGVVPLGALAAGIHGEWSIVGQLAIGFALTYGTRMFAMYLAHKVDRAAAEASIAEVFS